ncbi:serine/threonine protein kinase [Actinomadura scrupuli]|uniref:serine/threonine protein kinase n=1 Tax=Actinomadura scrupuli TaxID=559629 RepID=UPI003D958671
MTSQSLPPRVKPRQPQDPARYGAYEVLGRLGEGGMGLVHLGRAPDGGLVAIKVVRAELARNPEFRARFRREAESAQRVPRFCTAEVLGADPDAPEPYLVTEFIDGPTLEEVVRAGGPLQRAELDQLGVSMAAALTGIHRTGVMHRDLKPSNVLLSRMGPRVIDFGIASAVDAVRLTADGQAMGTPTYMAPEQLEGRPIPASDVFAWGGVMAFAATGRRPFGTGPLPEVAARIMQAEPDLGGLTGPLRDVITAAMTKDHSRRPSSGDLLEMLGVSGTDPAMAVRTRLAGMGLPGPAEPPPDQTRHDIPTQPRAGYAEQAGSAHTTPVHPAGTPGDGVSMRFGPGVAVPDAATAMWRGGRSPAAKRRRRRRLGSLFSTLFTLAILGGVIAWLLLQNRTGDLAVNDVRLQVEKLKKTCGDVRVTGTVTTNGEPGVLTYQWWQSDKKQPEDQQEQNIGKGQKSIALPFLWKINGKGQNKFTATLTVSGPEQQSKTASIPFTYVCRG